jgi:hypothetical protein
MVVTCAESIIPWSLVNIGIFKNKEVETISLSWSSSPLIVLAVSTTSKSKSTIL